MKIWPQQNKTSLDICIAICYKGYHIIYESIVKARLLSPSADIYNTIYIVNQVTLFVKEHLPNDKAVILNKSVVQDVSEHTRRFPCFSVQIWVLDQVNTFFSKLLFTNQKLIIFLHCMYTNCHNLGQPYSTQGGIIIGKNTPHHHHHVITFKAVISNLGC